MFNALGIRGRVLLLTLLPSSLLAVVLGGYFIGVQLADLQAQLLDRGQLIAEQLAPLAAPALAAGDIEQLQRIAARAVDQRDVRGVAFLDAQRIRLARAGARMRGRPPQTEGAHMALRSSEDATRLLLPVFRESTAADADPAADDRALLGWVELELSHKDMLLQGYRNLLTSLLLIGTGLLVTALLALRMGRSITEPLRRIQQGVALLSEGRLETRLAAVGSHELDELCAGINRMAKSLQNAQEELQHSIDQATEDVRQNLEIIEIQNVELSLARKEALEASRIKSEFLANMSHEIRTPLNGILGFTQLLQKSELTPRQQDYLATIETSASSLLMMINEILDFSKIEAGRLVLEHIPFSLRELLQETLTILAPAAHQKQLELVSLVDKDAPLSLLGDPLRLKQVLTNLLGNAIKFTHSGSIVLRARLEDQRDDRARLRISVQDTGIGLAEPDLQELFKAFSQADNSLSRQAGGSGLGLVISKRLIEQMGGAIGVDSRPGEGSEFWITLDLPKAHDDVDELPRGALGGHPVAVFEPHELARQALRQQLEDCGLQVHEYPSLESLAAAVAAQRSSAAPIGLAVLGVTLRSLPAQTLAEQLWRLERLGCKTLVLCPTTEQATYQHALHDSQCQLQTKPAYTRKLQRALSDLLGAPPGSKPAAMPAFRRAPRLLCVDDNPANLLLVQTLLGELGAEVMAVDNGQAALEAVRRHPFDLVLMDVQMPGMDGRRTTEAIRAWEAQENRDPLPIVALTAHALASEKRILLQSGMDDYLTKPISERQLTQVVLKWSGLSLQALSGAEPPKPATRPATLPVLDEAQGLQLAAGKAELAAELLAMLLASLEADRQAIRQAREQPDRARLIERVHRLHGATRYCGVPQLREACQRCETLLEQNHPAVDEALDALDAAIARLLAAAESIA